MPEPLRSSVYFPAPVVLPAASTMAIGLPRMEKSVICRWPRSAGIPSASLRAKLCRLAGGLLAHLWGWRGHRRYSLLLGHHRGLNRLVHLVVPSATAQIPAERAADFFFCWLGVHCQQMPYGHNETRRAKSTLCSSPVAISLLDSGQAAAFTHTFYGGDLLPFTAGRQHGAGEHGNAIHLDSTGATRRIVAATLGAGKLQVQTQCVKQQRAGLDSELEGAAVDAKFDELFSHVSAFSHQPSKLTSRAPLSVQRYLRVDGAGPFVNPAPHRLHFFESLLA